MSPRTQVRQIIRRLAFRDVRHALTTPGQISLREAIFLSQLVKCLDQPGPIVEIGTLFGWSTRVMTLAKPPEKELITVDSYGWNPLGLSESAHFDVTSAILAESKLYLNVKQIRQDKANFYQSYSGAAPALIFLDAMHTYDETRKDLEWATKFNNSIICLHDYTDLWPGVIQAVDELGGPHRIEGSLCALKQGVGYEQAAEISLR